MLPLPVQFPGPDFSRSHGFSSDICCNLPVFSWTTAAESAFPPRRHESDVFGYRPLFWLRRELHSYRTDSDKHTRLPAESAPDPAQYAAHYDPDTVDLPPDLPESAFHFEEGYLPGRRGISLRSPSLHQHLPPLFLLHGVLSDKSSENSPDAHRGILRLALHFSEYRFLPVLSDSCEVSPFLRIAAERQRFSEIIPVHTVPSGFASLLFSA